MRENKFKIALISAIVIVLILLFLYGYLPRLHLSEKLQKRAEKVVPPSVNVFVAKPQDAPIQLVLPSITQADHVTPVWARANGYLGQLLCDIGDEVKKGDMLAVLETPDVDQQYLESQHTLSSTKAARDIAELTMFRNQTLYNHTPGAVARQLLDESIASFAEAEANWRTQQATVEYYRTLREYKKIEAPFDGIIIERNVDIGSLVTSGSGTSAQQLFVIANIDVIRAYVSVPQYVVLSIKEGVEAEVHLREYQDESFPCKVVRYAKSLDQVSHTMLTQLDLDNKERKLTAGLYAQVHFSLKPSGFYYVLPVASIIFRTGYPLVAVLDENDVVHLKRVKIGLDNGQTMQIVAGINPDDRIVSNASDRIREGVKVTIIKTEVEETIQPIPIELSAEIQMEPIPLQHKEEL